MYILHCLFFRPVSLWSDTAEGQNIIHVIFMISNHICRINKSVSKGQVSIGAP